MAKVVTDYWPKPIPLRQFDGSAVFDDYEPGAPQGFGRTEAAAVADLHQEASELQPRQCGALEQ